MTREAIAARSAAAVKALGRASRQLERRETTIGSLEAEVVELKSRVDDLAAALKQAEEDHVAAAPLLRSWQDAQERMEEMPRECHNLLPNLLAAITSGNLNYECHGVSATALLAIASDLLLQL